jgi:hypothetical protein
MVNKRKNGKVEYYWDSINLKDRKIVKTMSSPAEQNQTTNNSRSPEYIKGPNKATGLFDFMF